MNLNRAMVSLALMCLVLPLFGQSTKPRVEEEPDNASVRFIPLHITLDPRGETLAAYQFELKTTSGRVKIVGVEGGDHAAFGEPPFYDARALMQDRVIIAAFSTEPVLPTTATRVTTLHLQVLGDIEPQFNLDVMVAADSQSHSIETVIQHQLGEVQ